MGQRKYLTQINLSGVNLSKMILRKVNLIRTQIHSDGLPNSKLPKTKMSYLDLSNAIFPNTNLYCANLSYADFPLVNLCQLIFVNLHYTNLCVICIILSYWFWSYLPLINLRNMGYTKHPLLGLTMLGLTLRTDLSGACLFDAIYQVPILPGQIYLLLTCVEPTYHTP